VLQLVWSSKSVRGGNAERFHFAIEMRALEAESAGGLCHVPAIFLELAQNEFAFVGAARFVQRSLRLVQTLGTAAEEVGRKVMRLDASLRANDDESLDEILQLSDVARPGAAQENFERGFAELTRFLAVFGTELIQEMTRENGNVFFAVAQRGNEKGNHVQAV